MMKQLSIAVALLFAVACKTDPPTQTNPAPAGDDTTTKARSAKIDVKPVQPPSPPALPAAPGPPTEQPRANDGSGTERPGRRDWRGDRAGRADANGDGMVSDEERAAAVRERVGNMRSRFDLDGDGKLTVDELAKAHGRIRFDDAASLDTNHDGDISSDELAAGLKARRDQRRAGRGPTDTPAQ